MEADNAHPQRNASDPTDLYMFGMGGHAGNKTFRGPAVNPLPKSNETAMGGDFAIWAWSMLFDLRASKKAER
jgi:hypothetical protein